MEAVPRVAVKNVTIHPGETMHISCFSDIHIESSVCKVDELNRVLRERSLLPNHSAIAIGDVMDLVSNTDLRRYRRSGQISRLHGVDAWLDEAIDYAVETLSESGVRWDLISAGNHEDEWLKRHGNDITSILAHRLGASRGGYSGVIDYRIFVRGMSKDGKKKPFVRFSIAYHHGNWGGKHAKGYLGAKEWAYRFDGWNVFLYGHNHAGRLDYERKYVRTKNGMKPVDVYLVNCSSWTDGFDMDNAINVHYSERKGYVPQPHRAPLIRVTPVKSGNSYSLRYSVEV